MNNLGVVIDTNNSYYKIIVNFQPNPQILPNETPICKLDKNHIPEFRKLMQHLGIAEK